QQLPPFAPWTLQIRSRHGNDVVTALPSMIVSLREWADSESCTRAGYLHAAADLASRFIDRLSAIEFDLADLIDNSTMWAKTADAYRLAEQYAVVHAASALIALSVYSRDSLPSALPDPAILSVCLGRLWAQIAPTEAVTPPGAVDAAAHVLIALHDAGQLFAHRQTPLANTSIRESAT
ncbi:MAG TPA: hypothetical protein VIO38_11700, partial [Rariglobus sp.]